MIYKTPKRLLQSREQILKEFGSKAPTNYDVSAWRKHFTGDSDFEQILQEFPISIRRSDMERLSRQVRDGGYKQIRKLFLASMIWGYVKDDLRGAWRTNQMLSYPRAEEMLEKAARSISNGQIIEACKGFTLPWCGSVFSTKFFYFIGLGAGISPLPCILDDRVAQCLEQLGREEGWDLPVFDNVYGKGVRRCPEGYIQYIWSLDKWAKELRCRADYIEYYLYSLATGPRRPKPQEEESMSKVLPLEKAYAFGIAKGYGEEISHIKSLKKPQGWENLKVGTFSRVRSWKVKELFEQRGIWDEFKRLHWPDCNQKYLDQCKRAAGAYSDGKDVIEVSLPKGELQKLREKAERFGVDPSTLARIWILERLS
jgi:hypothetical protein